MKVGHRIRRRIKMLGTTDYLALTVGACYLLFRIYSTFVRPFISPRRAKSGVQRADLKQAKLPMAPHHIFQDVA